MPAPSTFQLSNLAVLARGLKKGPNGSPLLHKRITPETISKRSKTRDKPGAIQQLRTWLSSEIEEA